MPFWRLASHEIWSQDSFELHTSWIFFTLFHILPLYNSHLNIGYLITKLYANLARNKANTWLNKFNLTNYNGFSIKLVKIFQDNWSCDWLGTQHPQKIMWGAHVEVQELVYLATWPTREMHWPARFFVWLSYPSLTIYIPSLLIKLLVGYSEEISREVSTTLTF